MNVVEPGPCSYWGPNTRKSKSESRDRTGPLRSSPRPLLIAGGAVASCAAGGHPAHLINGTAHQSAPSRRINSTTRHAVAPFAPVRHDVLNERIARAVQVFGCRGEAALIRV